MQADLTGCSSALKSLPAGWGGGRGMGAYKMGIDLFQSE